MNIREDLGRFLNETEQVMRTRRYQWLCSIALILSLAGIFHLFDGDFWKVRRLQKDIEEVAPQWEAFKRTNPGFDSIVFFASRDEASVLLAKCSTPIRSANPISIDPSKIVQGEWCL